ncbi:putative ribonuclease H-like domain-containing protein [Tanacetum coccineum]
MKPFGCPVTILNTIDHLGKFDGKADEGFFVGYSTNSKAFRVFNSRTRIVEENLHVQFSENTSNITGSGPNWLFDIDALTNSMNYKPVVTGNQSNANAGIKECDDASKARMETVPSKDYILLPMWPADPLFSQNSKESPDAGFKPSGEEEKKDAEDPGNESGNQTKGKVVKVPSTRSQELSRGRMIILTALTILILLVMETTLTMLMLLVQLLMLLTQKLMLLIQKQVLNFQMIQICLNWKILSIQMMRSVGADAAMKQFRCFYALIWTLVDLPNGKRRIGTKWVYRNKKDERGIVIKNKARLVAQGYTQEEGIDYDEVFTSVARIEAIRLFLAYASFKDFVVYQMDVRSAFLYGFAFNAPRAWYETLSTYLLDNRFQRGKIDKTLFIRRDKGDILLVQVYVDDIIFGSTKKELCTEFEKMMHKKFQMSSMGELTFFLGLQVKQKEDGIFISQDKYVTEILKKFGFSDVKTASTPMETHKPLLKDADGEDVDEHMYRSMIGSLMYLTSSRPDIMFVVCVCARFQVNPKVSHLHAVKRIFRYLKGQPKLGLWYPKDSPFDLVAYTDSDYAGASLDRKSTIGGCQFLGCRLISWQCKKQTVVANSITEAEYVAASIKNPVFHLKTKHIEIRHHFIRDSNEKKLIQMIKIHTDKNVADFLTKAFDKGIGVNASDSKLMMLGINLPLLDKVNAAMHTLQLLVFWASAKVKTVNGEVQLQALVDGKKVIITETSVRRYLQLEDAIGIECLPNAEIFEQLALMGYGEEYGSVNFLMYPRFVQVFLDKQVGDMSTHDEIFVTPSPTKKSNDPPLSRVNTLRSGEDRLKLKELIDLCTKLSDTVLDLETTKTGQVKEIASLKKRVKKLERKRKSKSPGMKRLFKIGRSAQVVSSEDEVFELVKDSSKKAEAEMAQESSSKREEEELEQEVAKEQKIDDDKEEAEMKKLIKVVPDEEEVAINDIPLSTKPPSIVDYKIIKEGKINIYQIIRVDESLKRYSTVIHMLKNFDREDLETLWKIVKARHGYTRLEEGYERVLWGDLKTMFEHHVEDLVWRYIQGNKVTVWKLFDSCGVHFVRFSNMYLFMLVEKRYPFTKATITEMLNKKLQVDHWNEMCYQLLKLMTKQLKNQ